MSNAARQSSPQRPAARLQPDVLSLQAADMAADATIIALIEAMPEPVAILNDRRQIVAANKALFEAIGATGLAEVIGQRPGDVMGCVEARRGSDGCGTAPACRVCGAGKCLAALESGTAGVVQAECLITRRGSAGDEALEFVARANRLPEGWVVFTLRSLADEKRRAILERCFFHDLLNSATGIQSLAELVAHGEGEFAGLLSSTASNLVEEIRHHQILAAAENGTLTLHNERLPLARTCREVAVMLARLPMADGRRLVVHADDAELDSDRVLLRRVLINLIRNALEASTRGSVIDITARREGGRVVITVSNTGEMLPDVQFQVFRRSFTTKEGDGRGVGTWSVKLLVERYLDGQVSFTVGGGLTTFRVELP